MLSVRGTEAQIAPLLNPDLSIAAQNAPSLCVVSGTTPAIEALEEKLTQQQIVHRRLFTSHAFHSQMMEPITGAFREEAARIKMSAPRIPYISSVTGDWITPEDATSPDYWTRHLRQAVQFSSGIARIQQREELVLLEVGPGRVLVTLARQNLPRGANRIVLSSLADTSSEQGDADAMLQALGSLWTAGIKPDWQKLHARAKCQRISLPTYPFERKRFWLSDSTKSADTGEVLSSAILQAPHPVDPSRRGSGFDTQGDSAHVSSSFPAGCCAS